MQGQNNPTNVELIKKNILYGDLAYNLREQKIKEMRKRDERTRQIEQYQIINRRVSTELSQDFDSRMKKKNYVRNILAEEYDRQIQQKYFAKKDEINIDRSYAKIEEDYQKDYQAKRARDLARILKTQKVVPINNPEYDEIRTEISLRNSRDRVVTETNDLADNKNYAQYLKNQIERKRIQKDKQKRDKQLSGQLLAQKNSDALSREMQEQKLSQISQKLAFKKHLDDQIYQKNHIMRRPF